MPRTLVLPLVALAALVPSLAGACTTCNEELQASLFDRTFLVRFVTIPVPLIAGGLAAAAATRRLVSVREGRDPGRTRFVAPVVGAGMLIGLGLGGFLDGIVLHQILQVHQMISNVVAPTTVLAKNVNMFWDGMFHVGAWTLTAAGIWALWRSVGRTDVATSTSTLLGSALLGWGAFNLIDSVWNHYLLRYHDLVEASGNPWLWNHAFLAFGVIQAAIGGLIVARATGPAPSPAKREEGVRG